MLQNAYFLAKIGADTAENEQHFAEILPKTCNSPTGPLPHYPACARSSLRRTACAGSSRRRATKRPSRLISHAKSPSLDCKKRQIPSRGERFVKLRRLSLTQPRTDPSKLLLLPVDASSKMESSAKQRRREKHMFSLEKNGALTRGENQRLTALARPLALPPFFCFLNNLSEIRILRIFDKVLPR